MSVSRLFLRLAFGVAVLGTGLAIAARLGLPGAMLSVQYSVDPALSVVGAALLLAVVLVAVSMLYGAFEARLRQSLSSQAAAQDTERRRFVQRLDHELKNPLTAIQVHLDNLQAAGGGSAEVAEVRAQADRLAILTRGLRRLSDLETRALQLERVEIGELLDEVVDLVEAAERINLDVQKVPWPIPPIEADRELLLIVFRNLVDNALKYSSGAVQVRARHTSGALVVEVIDTGRGIPDDDQPLILGELYRGGNVRDIPGSGLGLAMVNRIIDRHHGRLEMRSRSGQGTIATVQLPYDQAPAQ